MVDTFKLMTQIRQAKYSNKSNEELAAEYSATNNQSILAELFCKNFSLFNSLVCEPKYSYIDNEDKVSSVLSCIHNAAKKFDTTMGYVFNTFVIKCIRTELAQYIEKMMWKKRRSGNLYSLENMCEKYDNTEFEINFVKPYDDSYDTVELIKTLETSNLSNNELLVCKAVINDKGVNNNELADMLNCHRHTVRNIKNSLKTKLATII